MVRGESSGHRDKSNNLKGLSRWEKLVFSQKLLTCLLYLPTREFLLRVRLSLFKEVCLFYFVPPNCLEKLAVLFCVGSGNPLVFVRLYVAL